MRAINYYLVVSDIKEEEKVIAGLIFTEKTDVDNRYSKANIISCGDRVEGVKEGDVVFYDKHAGHGITHEENFYKVIQIGDIVLVE